jgi:hypothetical protein
MVKKPEDIKDLLKLLEQLQDCHRDITENYFFRLKTWREKEKPEDYDYSVLPQRIASMESQLASTTGELALVKAERERSGNPTLSNIEKNVDCKKYKKYTPDQMRSEIQRLRDLIVDQNKEKGNTEFNIERHKAEIKRLESMKPHKYQNNFDELKKILTKVESLDAIVNNKFNRFIHDLSSGKLNNSNLNQEQKDFNELVSCFLGQKVGFVRYTDGIYEIKSIDLVSGVANTKEGKKIPLVRMGTGRSQSGYLMGLLNTSDNRKIIALFDEVAMMDDKSLEPIYDRFRELYNRNMLLAGIIIQRGKEIKVISKIR